MHGRAVVPALAFIFWCASIRCFGDTTITFDSLALRPTGTPPETIRANENVAIVIENIDTFTHKYSVRSTTTDYHNLTVPSALGGVANVRPPTVNGNGSALLGVSPDYPEPPQVLAERHGETAAPGGDHFSAQEQQQEQRWIKLGSAAALESEYTVMTKDIAALDEQMKLVPTSRVLNDIDQAITSHDTNATIRLAVINAIYADLAPLVSRDRTERDRIDVYLKQSAAVQSTAGFYRNLYGQFEGDIDKVASDIGDSFATPYQQFQFTLSNWNRDYARYAFENESANSTSRDIAGKNEIIQTYVRQLATLSSEYDRGEIESVYRSMLDPKIVPVVIVNYLPRLRGDVVSAWVQIDSVGAPRLSTSSGSSRGSLATLLVQRSSASTRVYNVLSASVVHRAVFDYSLGVGDLSYTQTNYYVDSGGIVRQGSSDLANVGAAALVQIYLTNLVNVSDVSFSLGPCLGLIFADQTNYVAGGSLIISVTQRVRISGSYGISFGKVTDLNGETVGSKANGGSITTASHVTHGTFFALTGSFGF